MSKLHEQMVLAAIRLANACETCEEFIESCQECGVVLGPFSSITNNTDEATAFYNEVTAHNQVLVETVATRMQAHDSAVKALLGCAGTFFDVGLGNDALADLKITIDQPLSWTVETELSTDEINYLLDEVESKNPGVLCDFSENQDGSITIVCTAGATDPEFVGDNPSVEDDLPPSSPPVHPTLAAMPKVKPAIPADDMEFTDGTENASTADSVAPTTEAQAMLYQHAINEVSPYTANPKDPLAKEWENWILFMKSAKLPKKDMGTVYAHAWKGWEAGENPPKMSSKASSRRYIGHVMAGSSPSK